MIRICMLFCAALCALFSTNVFAEDLKKENLLVLPKVTLDADLSVGVKSVNERKSRDGNEGSAASYTLKNNLPQELVYSFGGETVSPESIKIKVKGIKDDQVKVEVLVSTLSASAGYTSLRVEPLDDSHRWQSFKFDQNAAKWVMIKFIPFKEDVTVSVVEIELLGHVGPPVTSYKFNESPAKAFEVLAKLKNSVTVNITDEEASVFKDAQDGTFDQWSFAEASLLSSGVVDKAQRQKYLQQIDTMEQQIIKLLPKDGSTFKRGENLLLWLHSGAFTKGYVKHQTDVSSVLKSNTFNCVSSATLYNILARRLGLDVRGIEVPDHAFSILYDGTHHADIETTTKHGFNPARNRAGISEFERQTGFVYIPDKNRSKRREVGETGMVAITYYNHGVEHSEKKEYATALSFYFRALSLDPNNNSAIKNALAVLANWSGELSKNGEFDKALSVLEVGMELAPEDRTLRHNNKVVWQRKIEKSVDVGDTEEALAKLKAAYQKTEDKSFLKMQSYIFLKQGESQVEKKDWEGALATAEAGLQAVDESAKREMEKWRSGVIIRWSNTELEKKNYALAVDVLERGLAFGKRDYRMENNLGYITQEWGRYVAENDGAEAGRKLVTSLSKRFPELSKVQRATSGFSDQAAKEAIDKGDYEGALAIYKAALEDRPDDYHLKRNRKATWMNWASGSMESRDWEKALSIYEKAYIEDPDAHFYKQNVEYIAQEWGRDVTSKEGALAAEKLAVDIAARFPNIRSLNRAVGNSVARLMQELIAVGDYERAEAELISCKEIFPNKRKYDKLIFNLYFMWAEPYSKTGDWAQVISVYNRGYEKHPKNSKIKRNLVASYHSMAKPLLDAAKWQEAMTVYEKGLESIPGDSSLKNNIRYCKSKLGI